MIERKMTMNVETAHLAGFRGSKAPSKEVYFDYDIDETKVGEGVRKADRELRTTR